MWASKSSESEFDAQNLRKLLPFDQMLHHSKLWHCFKVKREGGTITQLFDVIIYKPNKTPINYVKFPPTLFMADICHVRFCCLVKFYCLLFGSKISIYESIWLWASVVNYIRFIYKMSLSFHLNKSCSWLFEICIF